VQEAIAVELEPDDLVVTHRAPEGWAGVVDRDTQVAIDIRITPELAREGMARDLVRQMQEFRKESGLEIEDRIELYLGVESEKLRQPSRRARPTSPHRRSRSSGPHRRSTAKPTAPPSRWRGSR
jgi:isoleucyl-tRNA synthetase